MMNATQHPFLAEEMMAFLDGELSRERAAALAVHIESCTECGVLAANLRLVSGHLEKWKVSALPPHITIPERQEKAEGKIFALPHRYRGLIWAVSCAVALFLLFAIATPNLLRSRMAANEASAVGSLRTINASAAFYRDSYGHYPASLKSLGPSSSGAASEDGAGLIDSVLAQGFKSGYFFSYRANSSSGYRVSALPVEAAKSGVRSFFTDQSGVIRAQPGGVLEGGETEVARLRKQGLSVDRALVATPDGQVALPAGSPKQKTLSNPTKVWTLNGPLIAHSVSLSIVVKDFAASRSALDAILARYKGYAASLTVSAPQESARSLQASLRIPASQLAAAIDELKALGSVDAETQNGDEVTQQHADLVARLKNSAETEQRLQAILQQRTGKVTDVLSVEQEIARVRGEIEQMEAQQKSLEHRVDFATVEVKLSEEYKAQLNSAAPSVATQIHNALVNGYRNVADTLLALILLVAEYGPVLLLWCVILSVPGYLVWRRWRAATAHA